MEPSEVMSLMPRESEDYKFENETNLLRVELERQTFCSSSLLEATYSHHYLRTPLSHN